MNMGKISALLLSALFATVILTPMINRVQADIDQWTWLPGYVYRGYDYYYDYSYPIIAFLNGTTATLKVPVYNNYWGLSINVTGVFLVFDTGWNISAGSYTKPNQVNITYGDTHYFDISFTPYTSSLSNLWAHTFIVYVEFEYEGGTDEWSMSWNNWDIYPNYKFVVYTPEQKDARDLEDKIDEYADYYAPEDFHTIKGRLLAVQALVESGLGSDYNMRGNFTEAKTHYQTAVNLYEQALGVEEDKGIVMEDAQLDAMQKEANATVRAADAAMLQAEALMNQAYGYLLLGLGFVLIGIGAIVYGVRKPKTV